MRRKRLATGTLVSLGFIGLLAASGCFSLELSTVSAVGGPEGGASDGALDGQNETSTGTDGSTSDGAAVAVADLGDGHRGALTVDAAGKIINTYGAVAAAAQAGAKTLVLASGGGFASGDLVLIVQTAGLSPGPASGDATPIDLQAGVMGRWELARLTGIAGSQLILESPLANDVAASGAQVVTVPEHTDVAIPAGTSLSAPAWDGRVGGILAFFAKGTVTNIGGIDVSARGFRSGLFKPGGTGPCTTFDLAPPAGGQKGEGLVTGSFGDAIGGYGNIANAGGGGNCSRGGGGGGGNGGPGGKGGAVDGTDHAGRGGVALKFNPLQRLSIGGGGGAGQGNALAGSGGGHGGGAVFLHAGGFAGTGFVRANGESAPQSAGDSGGDSAAGGGGAGGTIHLRVAAGLQCGGVEANGGAGGSSNGPNNGTAGPGGGGGGGRVVMQASTFSCPGGANAGAAGISKDGVSHQGAEPAAPSDPAHVGSVDIVANGP